MNNFKNIKLGDYIEVLTDYHANGSYQTLKDNVSLKKEEDYALMVRTLNFERDDYESDAIYLNESEYNFLEKSKVYPNDIVMNKIANPGSVYIMPDLERPVSLAMNLFLIRFNKKLNQRYMYYLMKINENYIKNFSNGTTTLTITKDAVRSLKFKVPPLLVQNQVEDILTAIDLRIELNNKMSSSFELLINDIYKYWFEQFDFPNENGEPYNQSGGELIYNQQLRRRVPKSWQVKKLKDIFEFEKGTEPGASQYLNSASNKNCIKFYRVGDIDSDSSTYVEVSKSDLTLVNKDDVVVTFDGSVGKVGFGFDGAISGGIRKIYDKSGKFNSGLVYFIFSDERINKTIHRYASGSILLHASSSIDYLSLPFDEKVFLKFQKFVTPYFEKMQMNKSENQQLLKLRDWLLPMLINGQVKVKN